MSDLESLAGQGGKPVRESFLPFSRPSFGEEEKRELIATLESGWITTGPRVSRFERELSRFVGSAHAVCVDSCTAALHLALAVLDLKPGDEVITSPLTFCSTVNAVIHAGGTPVLADVEPDTLNLDPEAVRGAVGDRTRAVIPVHFGGHPCDMDPLRDLARAEGLTVIEDAAHALGAAYKGRAVGTLGDAACFSFYATKNMTTAEGGALVTENEETAKKIRALALHGMDRDAWDRYTSVGSWYYEVLFPGFKYSMTDLDAALGLQQLRRLPGFNQRRRELAKLYDEGFAGHPAVSIPANRPDVENVYQLYPIRLRLSELTVDRSRFIQELKSENIGASVHFIPIHYHPAYRDRLHHPRGSLPVSETAYEALISLPIYPAMSDADARDVIAGVRKMAAHFSR